KQILRIVGRSYKGREINFARKAAHSKKWIGTGGFGKTLLLPVHGGDDGVGEEVEVEQDCVDGEADLALQVEVGMPGEVQEWGCAGGEGALVGEVEVAVVQHVLVVVEDLPTSEPKAVQEGKAQGQKDPQQHDVVADVEKVGEVKNMEQEYGGAEGCQEHGRHAQPVEQQCAHGVVY
ncbi:hypothetical protein FA15DRAFT_662126, partial [Coprinopsis marcescibilis]